ncbi:hypothetical protein [Staphylococcus delphini]|uniref:hypothetical protein n=1 Tax=Staphylococcus delphini TaxID=53344 RepID=UPI000BBBC2F6|nr:hypothetical protein [Staphylococcus delphini]HEC2153174.1 hypothetical protein [Staphylococcus delphini]HEC2156430.1 hypothetical protein [Staphylococcus delphini]HEC2176442.1 hypothetical protein [Staphylococcus delphini]
MFLVELKCSHCNKKLTKDDEIMIKTKVSELKGITNLKSWATLQKIYCQRCYNSKESV